MTLKELKKKYPDKIQTQGSIYFIDGFGYYQERKNKVTKRIVLYYKSPLKDYYTAYKGGMDALHKELQQIFD